MDQIVFHLTVTVNYSVKLVTGKLKVHPKEEKYWTNSCSKFHPGLYARESHQQRYWFVELLQWK